MEKNKITLEEFYDLIEEYNMLCKFGKEISDSNLDKETFKRMEIDGMFKTDKYVVVLIDHRNEPEFGSSSDYKYHVLSKTTNGGYASVGTDLSVVARFSLFDYDEIPEKYRPLAIKQSEVE